MSNHTLEWRFKYLKITGSWPYINAMYEWCKGRPCFVPQAIWFAFFRNNKPYNCPFCTWESDMFFFLFLNSPQKRAWSHMSRCYTSAGTHKFKSAILVPESRLRLKACHYWLYEETFLRASDFLASLFQFVHISMGRRSVLIIQSHFPLVDQPLYSPKIHLIVLRNMA